MRLYNYIMLIAAVAFCAQLSAKENAGLPKTSGKTQVSGKLAAACVPATSQIDLDVNNVRATLLNGGDYWWDLNDGMYVVPKVERGSGDPPVSSIFAGALWIGGLDQGNNLKMAAQTYRQSGNDFWPGPLAKNGTTDEDICDAYDRHWKVNRDDIEAQIENANSTGGSVALGDIPKSILEWPGKGNPHAVGAKGIALSLSVDKDMAPFEDFNGNGIYNPEEGDYPALIRGGETVIPDQMIWWIYNDKGDIHTETGGEAIGLEIQITAFAYATNDEINDMTFYAYKVKNFGTQQLDSVYFGQWVDADLGLYTDDFVGCDPSRALGFIYNGDAVDGPGGFNYGASPPICGVDFFQGPKKYFYNGSGNIIDSTILGMSKFVYYNNDFSITGNPEVASHHYGYLSGSWKDGSCFTFGGNAYQTGACTDYMFPDDPSEPLPAWSECSEGNVPADRRYVQSSGPFRLDPGAENEVIIGVVWVPQSSQTGCFADIDKLRIADDKAQALFDNNFKLIDGPDAPDLTIRELDEEIIIALTNNTTLSNNNGEQYEETDPIVKSIIESLPDSVTNGDSTYNFQGYRIFQLADAQVSPSEYSDPTRARQIAQFDIEDGVAKLINFTFDSELNADVPVLKVNGNDNGINHVIRVTEDAFATGTKDLVNFRTYYFSAVAYAYNNYLPYDPSNDQSQRLPYLEGRQNIKIYSAIPHKPAPELYGSVLNADYGDGPQIQRINGLGLGKNAADFTAETISEILANTFDPNPIYEGGAGPVDIFVFDPVAVPAADFELAFYDTSGIGQLDTYDSTAYWTLTNKSTGEVYEGEYVLGRRNQQVIPEIGLVVNIQQVETPGTYVVQVGNDVQIFEKEDNNGFIEGTKDYADDGLLWLTSVPDGEQRSSLNWIRSGNFSECDEATPPPVLYDDAWEVSCGRFNDPNEAYEDVIDGTWAPGPLVGGLRYNAPNMPFRLITGLANFLKMDSIPSIDVVLTNDKSKWTRCVVVEMSEDGSQAEGGASKLELRQHASWNMGLDENGRPVYDQSEMGRSWFPGYAINLETGKRLNIVFSESSYLVADNGNDMIWNPTDRLYSQGGGFEWRFGGRHFIYVMNTEYDEGAAALSVLANANTTDLRNFYKRLAWVSTSMLSTGSKLKSIADGIVPTETTIRLRVTRPYRKWSITSENNGDNLYTFNTGDLAPTSNSLETAQSALDLIKVVPNPYYAYSKYETTSFDNRVKITNLPPKCTVSIFSPNGVLVRRFERDVPGDNTAGATIQESNLDTSIDWDLKNTKNVPVASGVYIIHVNAPDIGEKVVKWFGVMRPIDLDTF